MKRPVDSSSSDPASVDDDAKTNKKVKPDEPDPDQVPDNTSSSSASVLTDEDLLHEVLKHADARTVATSACVNRQWRRTASDERLWELICGRHWAHIGSGSSGGSTHQLRSVVLALGGFRRLHSLSVLPLSKPAASSSAAATSAWPCLPLPAPVVPARSAAGKSRWGKDEMHLSLSLLSIRYYEKMNFNNRGK
ncbi:F-box protein GID2-like [Rhododendron vialii]|uniref:F-box protein GID2-like n=1 Tax=Rhododendron vialii TaxID=182163 RepID=UPI00265FAF8F|nr:F-box protein GID2-like [Rhododendron vialii]